MNSTVLVLVFALAVSAIIIVAAVLVAGICSISGRFTFKRTFLKGLWALLIVPVLLVYGGYIERNMFRVKKVEVESANLPEAFDGYKIVHISDIHLLSFQGRERALKRAVKKINSLDPDIICFSGDLVTISSSELTGSASSSSGITSTATSAKIRSTTTATKPQHHSPTANAGNSKPSSKSSTEPQSFKDILSQLHARDGVFSVLGNHDYCRYGWTPDRNPDKEEAELIATERAMGWKVLNDESVTIRRSGNAGTCGNRENGNTGRGGSISIIGVQNISPSGAFRSYGNLSEAMSNAGGDFKILIAHDPDVWRSAVVGKDAIDLTLSGHTHAMQLSLFGWTPSRFLFKECWGLYKECGEYTCIEDDIHHSDNNMSKVNGKNSCKRKGSEDGCYEQYLYVNPGLGETIFPLRIGVMPEITLITLKCKD